MIEVDPRTRSSLYALVGVLLAAGWIAYGMLGNGNQVFLTVMVLLSVVSGALITFLLRSRRPS